MESKKRDHLTDDAPPMLGSWKALYMLVAGVFVLLVVIFSLLSIYLQ